MNTLVFFIVAGFSVLSNSVFGAGFKFVGQCL
jgi:hypothetical protein